MQKRRFKLLILVIIIAVAAGGYWYWNSQKQAKQAPQTPKMPPTMVDANTVQARQWMPEINATGTLSAMQGVELKSETSGRIQQIMFQSGQYVETGTPLLQINPDVLKAQLTADMSALTLSKLDYQRSKSLFGKKVISKADLDSAQATYQAAEAKVKQTQAQLDQTLIRAPFNGKLGLRLVELGEYLTPGQDIVNLQSLNPLRVDFSIPEIYLSQLAVGQTVKIQARSYPDDNFIGKVYAFDAAVDVSNRSLKTRAKIPNPDGKLLPGTFVTLQLRVGQPRTILVIPETAIVYSHEGNYVYRILEDRAVRTPVELGAKQAGNVEIKSGLSKDDLVVTAGQVKLADGMPIQVRNKK